ncbi:MAG TPA: ATP-dependent DNA helicase RecG [Verrucomicrobiae bacterium]|jgi:ATP-dependent DNA helicase RecG
MPSPENITSPLALPVSSAWGVGEERARLLARLKIFTVEDLLQHKPRRYEDRRKFLPIRELKVKELATVRGKIIAAGVKPFKRGARSLFECVFDDGTARLHCRWWQAQSWMPDWYAVGREFLIYGKLDDDKKPRTFTHPETEYCEPGDDEFIHVNRIVPIHPLTEGLTARAMRSLIWHALERFESQVEEPMWSRNAEARSKENHGAESGNLKPSTWNVQPPSLLPARANALRMIHFPEELTDVEIARQRLALDEFVALQFQIQSRRKKFEALSRGLSCGGDNRLMKPFLAELGFKLTMAQTNVLREIRADMGGEHPMRRLLQGDVGSGKTAVAACAALMALESGFNAVLMAPTEILAEQHYRNFQKWFSPLGVEVKLQTGSRKISEEEKSKLEEGQHKPVIFVGTHALFTAGFDLLKLGLVIIDEQHKFGVTQREALVRKGNYPHLLVMTATPIPRTLGLTLYGDLDVSVIDELPGGRGTIKTFVRATDKLPKVFDFIREKITGGRQAYIVYPRVEVADTDKEIKAVTREFQNVQQALAPFSIGLLHGRIKPAAKEAVMADFRANKIQALVATSLIEVGVDVPNATVMLIENAEHFGLAQLHQLRGRIGRGAHESFCILISDAENEEAQARLKILEATTDGFKIAEADLKLRGPGELLGQQQSGLLNLRFGNLAEDLPLIRQARGWVKKML